MQFDCKVLKTLAIISAKGTRQKRLSIVQWNGGTPTLDLRTWTATEDGWIPCKGTTLTQDEAIALLEALDDFFPLEDEPQTEDGEPPLRLIGAEKGGEEQKE